MKAVVETQGWLFQNKARSKDEIIEVTSDQFMFFERLGILSKPKKEKKEVKKNVDNKHSKSSNTD